MLLGFPEARVCIQTSLISTIGCWNLSQVYMGKGGTILDESSWGPISAFGGSVPVLAPLLLPRDHSTFIQSERLRIPTQTINYNSCLLTDKMQLNAGRRQSMAAACSAITNSAADIHVHRAKLTRLPSTARSQWPLQQKSEVHTRVRWMFTVPLPVLLSKALYAGVSHQHTPWYMCMCHTGAEVFGTVRNRLHAYREWTDSLIHTYALPSEGSQQHVWMHVCMYVLFRNQQRDVKAHEVVPSSCTLSFLCLSYTPLPKCLHAF